MLGLTKWVHSSSIVINHFRARAQAGVAHIYFNYKEQDSQKPIQVLASLLRQLANRVPDLPIVVGKLYEKSERPTMDELYVALLEVSKSFTQVFFVFDALDECDLEGQRREFLLLFQRMGEDGICVFLTSRPHPEDLQASLCDASKIELSAQGEDIVAYIKGKIKGNSRARVLVQSAECQDMIISGLVESAKGM